MRTITRTILSAALALGLGACENGATAPEGSGTLQVAAQGGDGGAARSTSAEGTRFSRAGAEGTVDFTARVYARTGAGSWVELTRRGAEHVVVDASGRAGAQAVTTAQVAAGGYDRVRVVFEDVRASSSTGISLVAGVLVGSVSVDLRSDHQVVVERPVSAEVRAGGSATLLIDLNAGAWMNRADAQTRTVSEADFQSAVTVSVR